MINLRYHIVSVVAVFLALGIGLALGSTFVDSILVNELEDQVRNMIIRNEEGSFPCQFDNCDYIAGKFFNKCLK